MSANTTTWERGPALADGSATYVAHEYAKTATVSIGVDGLTHIRVFSAKRTDYALNVAHGETLERVQRFAAGLLRSAARPVTTKHRR